MELLNNWLQSSTVKIISSIILSLTILVIYRLWKNWQISAAQRLTDKMEVDRKINLTAENAIDNTNLQSDSKAVDEFLDK